MLTSNFYFSVYMSLHICLNPQDIQLQGNPKVNSGLWVIIMRQYRLMDCNRVPLWSEVLKQGRPGEGDRRDIWEISVFLSQFCYEPKTLPKKIKFLKNVLNYSHSDHLIPNKRQAWLENGMEYADTQGESMHAASFHVST